MRELLGVEVVNLYSIAEGRIGYDLTRFHAVGLPRSFSSRFERFLASAPRRYGQFDPDRPEPSQRNRVILATPSTEPSRPERQIVEQVLGPAGIGTYAQLRVLLCEGPSLLAWFGAISGEPFTMRHRRILRALAKPMHRRLLAERRIERGKLATHAVDALLEAVASPAFIVDDRARIREINSAGRRLLATRDREVRAALADALAGRPSTPRIRLTRLHDGGAYWLAIAEVDRVQARVAAATERLALTQREAEVLLWVVRGASNQRIAAELACSERNVEAHLARMFEKADVPSRTALVALVLA
jgi:DNA-binding CsgD family transcriptional regulator